MQKKQNMHKIHTRTLMISSHSESYSSDSLFTSVPNIRVFPQPHTLEHVAQHFLHSAQELAQPGAPAQRSRLTSKVSRRPRVTRPTAGPLRHPRPTMETGTAATQNNIAWRKHTPCAEKKTVLKNYHCH